MVFLVVFFVAFVAFFVVFLAVAFFVAFLVAFFVVFLPRFVVFFGAIVSAYSAQPFFYAKPAGAPPTVHINVTPSKKFSA